MQALDTPYFHAMREAFHLSQDRAEELGRLPDWTTNPERRQCNAIAAYTVGEIARLNSNRFLPLDRQLPAPF